MVLVLVLVLVLIIPSDYPDQSEIGISVDRHRAIDLIGSVGIDKIIYDVSVFVVDHLRYDDRMNTDVFADVLNYITRSSGIDI